MFRVKRRICGIIILIIKINTNVFTPVQKPLPLLNLHPSTLHLRPRHPHLNSAQSYESLYRNQFRYRYLSRNWSYVTVFSIKALKSSARMLNLVVSSDVPVALSKSMVLRGFSTPPCPNRVLQGLPLVWLLLDILPLHKFNLAIIFSLLLIKLSMRLPNTGTDQVDNLNVEN